MKAIRNFVLSPVMFSDGRNILLENNEIIPRSYSIEKNGSEVSYILHSYTCKKIAHNLTCMTNECFGSKTR